MADRVTDAAIIERLVNGPMGQLAVEEMRQERDKERARLAAEIAGIREAQLKALPALLAAQEAAQKQLQTAEAAVKTAGQAVGEAILARRQAGLRVEREIATRQVRLTALAPACLGELKAWALEEHERVRRDVGLPTARSVDMLSPWDVQRAQREQAKAEADRAARHACLTHLREVPALCESWLLAGLSDDELELQCEAERAAIELAEAGISQTGTAGTPDADAWPRA